MKTIIKYVIAFDADSVRSFSVILFIVITIVCIENIIYDYSYSILF